MHISNIIGLVLRPNANSIKKWTVLFPFHLDCNERCVLKLTIRAIWDLFACESKWWSGRRAHFTCLYQPHACEQKKTKQRAGNGFTQIQIAAGAQYSQLPGDVTFPLTECHERCTRDIKFLNDVRDCVCLSSQSFSLECTTCTIPPCWKMRVCIRQC